MKIKKSVDLCKKRGCFYLFVPEGGEQWISDGVGCYPLGDVPLLNVDTLCTIFDIPDKAREKMVLRDDVIPPGFCFDDVADNESLCEQGPLVLGDGKNGVIPYKTSQGIQFINRKYMEPLEDSGDIAVYERMSPGGTLYFAVKRGMLLVALIMPYDMINEPFVESLKDLAALCEVALFNKKAEAEQLEMEDIHEQV